MNFPPVCGPGKVGTKVQSCWSQAKHTKSHTNVVFLSKKNMYNPPWKLTCGDFSQEHGKEKMMLFSSLVGYV